MTLISGTPPLVLGRKRGRRSLEKGNNVTNNSTIAQTTKRPLTLGPLAMRKGQA